MVEPSLPKSENAGIPSDLPFPVVGVGASAGGLVALKTLLESLPANSGMAFVVVVHLSPRHESSADKLLQRATRMPVVQVVEPTRIERNTIYIISPANDLEMNDGYLRIRSAMRPYGKHVAIDRFFRTLAEVHQDRSIGVVLSGTGSDGTVGISSIKEQGGVTLAQLPEDAEYGDMPRHAIATGNVDFVLPVADMGQQLLRLWQNARNIELPPQPGLPAHVVRSGEFHRADEEALRDIIRLLSVRTGHDFHHYKRATVLRRIERRLQVNLLKDIHAYRDFLERHNEETVALLSDMLISVTNFFRDREAFEAIEREVIPQLFAQRRENGEPVRVWVPACASGEEAYSLAMLLCDEADRFPSPPPIQVFATDIDEAAVSRGRTGLYPESIAVDVPPARLRNYFTKEQRHYRIKKSLRDKVLFAAHNVLRDPPFSRIDLISCRNLLIYLDRDIQGRLLQMFHFALRPGGNLFLGSSESADSATLYFEQIDKKNRIFRARGHVRPSMHVPMLPLRAGGVPAAIPPPTRAARNFSYSELHQRALERYAPPSVIVDQDYGILHISADAGAFLQFAGGEPTHNLLKIVHPSLRLELRSALYQAMHTKQNAEARKVALERGGETAYVDILVRPFRDNEAELDFALVLFDELDDSAQLALPAPVGDAQSGILLQLEEELQRTKERLQSTIEQSEVSTEELKASNEELQAINEELRSATEELETSKEELQSVNEELTTVNHELKMKVEEAAQINDDLHNFISSTEIATIFVDAGLRIKRYTPRAEDIFSIIPADIGRRLLDITHRLDYPELAADTEAAFMALQTREREVHGIDGRAFIARVLPYRTAENRIDGAVLTFVDVTSLRRAEERARALGVAPLPLAGGVAVITVDGEGQVLSWNENAEALFGYAASEIIGTPVARLYPDDAATATTLPSDSTSVKRELLHKDGRIVTVASLSATVDGPTVAQVLLAWPQQAVSAGAGTARTLATQQESGSEVAMRNTLKYEFLAVVSHELKHPLNLIGVNSELLLRAPEMAQSKVALRAVETIRRAVRGQAKIIDDLLDLSRMRTGKLKLNRAAINLAALAQSLVEVVQADVSTANLQIAFDNDDPTITVLADGSRVEQMLWNLIGNAIKFTPDEGRIGVRVFEQDRFGIVEVSDNGVGIDPDFQSRVFDMFGQGAARAASKQSGLGIGLALVRQLAERHGGRVEVSSPGLGQGSTFRLWLPLFRERSVNELGWSETIDVASLSGLRILIVDDAHDTVESLRELLSLTGAEVDVATSGANALEIASARSFDLMLSDIGMPDMDGNLLVEQVRRLPGWAHVPIIALSGFDTSRDVGRALQSGFDAHLAKPISLGALAAMVLELRRSGRATPEGPMSDAG